MTNLGLLPGIGKKYGERAVALAYNDSNRYEDRWVELKGFSKKCVFTKEIDSIRLPIAHGEGKFMASKDTLERLNENGQIVFRYGKNGSLANQEFPFNPNGALEDIAGICDETGRVFGLMPHPERNIAFVQQDHWTFLKEKLKREGNELPAESDGMKIFRNAVDFFR
jgi:phosphoribosylformylglycinamidine synthase